MFKVPFIGILFLLFLSYSGLSQGCFEYHKQGCTPQKSRYIYDYNNNSVSFLFKPGEVRNLPIELYAGKDYRITLCCDEVFQKVIAFSIIREDSKVLYDNTQHNYAMNMEFSAIQTQQVEMLIEIPDMDSSSIEGCVGILVEDMVSVKTGF